MTGQGSGGGSEPAGVIFQASSTAEFKLAITDPTVRKGMFLVAEHDQVGPVLCQVVDIEVQSNLTLDQAYRLSRGEPVDIQEKRSATAIVIGYRDDRGHILHPQTPLRLGHFVHVAPEPMIVDTLGLASDGAQTVYIGLLLDHDLRVRLDVNHLIGHHFSVIARTGSGKSYTVGVVVEELMKKDVPVIIVDPHGEYHSMIHPNIDVEPPLLRRFGIEPRGYPDQVIEFLLDPHLDTDDGDPGDLVRLQFDERNLGLEDLLELTGLRTSGTLIGILSRALDDLSQSTPYYFIEDIIETVIHDRSTMKWNIVHALEHIQSLGIFSKRATPITQLARSGQTTLLNLKGVPPHIQEVIVSRLGAQLFRARKRGRIPPMVLIVEEAHKYAPQKGTVLSSRILHTLASEGRKFGLGLGVVTQRPALVDKNVLSQCNTQLILKTTNPNDLKALGASVEGMTSYMLGEIQRLPVGVAMVVGGHILQPILVEVRVRETKHGGTAQSILGGG